MAKLVIQKSNIIVTCGTKAIALNVGQNNLCKILDVRSRRKSTSKMVQQCEAQAAAESCILNLDVSICGKMVVLCTNDKVLSLWETNTWTVLSNRTSARVASKVKFVPSGQAVVLADKSGDAYYYSVENPHEDGKLLLGHLSLLLDVLITPDEKYVITCDRDEKIRVSKYPNAYNIQSYCLGHKEFVTGLFLLPHDKSVLISSSGDGSIKFWNYAAGILLHSNDCNKDVFACKNIVKDGTEECILPVSLVSGCTRDATTSLISVCLTNVAGCLVYQINSDIERVSSNLVHVLRLQAEPWDIFLTAEKELWIIGPFNSEPLSVFMWDYSASKFITSSDPVIASILMEINSKWDLFQNISPTSFLPLLYKRKFDNIQEYQEKKKQRLTDVLAASISNVAIP